MKKTTRGWLTHVTCHVWANGAEDYAKDALASDAKKDATIRALRERLKHLRQRGPHLAALMPDEWERTLDLKNKNWRKP